MKKFTIEAYGTTVRAYEHDLEEAVKTVGMPIGTREMTPILMGGEFVFKEKRQTGPMYGHGYNREEKDFIILADSIDEKQLSNLFLSIGATEASIMYEDVSGVEIVSLKEWNDMLEYEIKPNKTDDAMLGLNTVIVADTLSEKDLIAEEAEKPAAKPKAKKKRK